MPENNARRVIITEGDGRSVYRVARKFEATAAIHLAPVDTAHSSRDFPGVRLVVEPSGAWRVEVMPQGDREPVTVAASGNLAELIPANRAAQPIDRTAWQYNEHSNQLGDWCPWSGKQIRDDADPYDDDEACPATCPDSKIEPAEVQGD